MTPPRDPLAGWKRKILSGEASAITWPLADYPTCPVQKGQLFSLARDTVTLEIENTQRVRKSDNTWLWRATFILHRKDRVRTFIGLGAEENVDETTSTLDALRKGRGKVPEPEKVDPAEIETYRLSRQNKQRYEEERHLRTADLIGAMNSLRSAIDSMPSERKRRMSRTLWTLRSRLDSAERELRRRNAA